MVPTRIQCKRRDHAFQLRKGVSVMKKQIDEKCKAQSGPFTNTVDKHSINGLIPATGRPISPQGIQYYCSMVSGCLLDLFYYSTFEK